MQPTYDQLVGWCAIYGVILTRTKESVTAIAYDIHHDPVAKVTVVEAVEELPKQSGDLKRALAVCDMLAEELCILKPSVTAKLNA
jgi:hypothetical protein